MIQVLVVDDSVTQREILRRLIVDGSQFAVVAEARNGAEAIGMVEQHRPDVVLMDIHMPGLDGIAATREIMARRPTPIVMASATLRKRDVDLAMKAFEAGAVAVIEKPAGAVLLHLHRIGPQLRSDLAAAARVKPPRRLTATLVPPPCEAADLSDLSDLSDLPPITALGLCASTGGPAILHQILSAIPRPFPVPMLLVQHISRGFEEGFAQWLSESTGHRVALAAAGQALGPGVWMAPGGRHLTLTPSRRLALAEGNVADKHCPSGNPLFQSLADTLGARAAGILLTGMGDDGAAGLLSMKQAGGVTVIQDERSSPIWGMPKAAQSNGAAGYTLSPEEIVHMLRRWAGRMPPARD